MGRKERWRSLEDITDGWLRLPLNYFLSSHRICIVLLCISRIRCTQSCCGRHRSSSTTIISNCSRLLLMLRFCLNLRNHCDSGMSRHLLRGLVRSPPRKGSQSTRCTGADPLKDRYESIRGDGGLR